MSYKFIFSACTLKNSPEQPRTHVQDNKNLEDKQIFLSWPPPPLPHSQLVGYNPCICHIAKHIMGRVSYFMTVNH